MRRLVLSFFLAFFFIRDGGAEDNPARATIRQELESFYKILGFEDYSSHIRDSLKKGRALNDIGVWALTINARRYEMVNEARRIAVLMLAGAYPRLQNPQFRKRFLAFSVKTAALKPWASPTEIPQSVKDAGPAAVDSFLESSARSNILLQSSAVLSEYSDLLRPGSLSPSETRELARLIAEYLQRAYLDVQIGSTQWLGRALLLGLTRYSVLRDKTLADQLAAEARGQNLTLENYVGSTVVLIGIDGPHRVPVKTGDLVFERSRDKESAAIASLALPENAEAAARMGLEGSLLDSIWNVSPEDMEEGLTWMQRRRIKKGQDERFSRGMSHVAQFIVYRDAATGIEHALIWDDYPYSVHLENDKDEEWGGIRVNGLEHFANPGHVARVGVVSLNKEKLFRIARDRLSHVQRHGWDPNAWISYIPRIDQDREIRPQMNPIRHDWRFQISQKDFLKLYGVPDAETWFLAYQERLARAWKTMMTEWGVWFYWIDAGAGLDEVGKYQTGRYWYGGMYCSQAVNLASLLFAGLDLEVRPSHYAHYVRWLGLIRISKVMQLDLSSRVIAPSSYALQPYSDPVVQAVYPPYSLGDLARFSFQPAPSSGAESTTRIPANMKNDSWDKGEREALIKREREYIEYVGLEKGKNFEQMFGKGRKAEGGEADRTTMIQVRRDNLYH